MHLSLMILQVILAREAVLALPVAPARGAVVFDLRVVMGCLVTVQVVAAGKGGVAAGDEANV